MVPPPPVVAPVPAERLTAPPVVAERPAAVPVPAPGLPPPPAAAPGGAADARGEASYRTPDPSPTVALTTPGGTSAGRGTASGSGAAASGGAAVAGSRTLAGGGAGDTTASGALAAAGAPGMLPGPAGGAGPGGAAGPAGDLAALPPGRGGPLPPEYEAHVRAFRRRIQERLRYPVLAVRRGLHGTVELEVRLDAAGRLLGVESTRGEVASLLRDAALQAVRDATPFPPGAGLEARALTIRLPIVFELR
jgi:TonB family protein